MAKTKNKKFTAIMKVEVETEVEIFAENYEQAIAKARELNVRDVVDFDTSYNDGKIEISGILDNSVRIDS